MKEITRRAIIKPHCSRIRRLRMMVFKKGPYLTCTPAYKLGKIVANDIFSVRFNDGLGWVSVSGILRKRKGSRTFGLKEITPRGIIKPHCSRIRRLRMMVCKKGP